MPGINVLVVDDIQINIDILSGILKNDYNVIPAISGEEAIARIQEQTPDLVLLDYAMPGGMDGGGVLKYMKENKEYSGIPVIFVTGEYDHEIEEQCLLMGAADYIKKPYNADIVKIKVRNHVDLKMYRDDLERVVFDRTRQLVASRDAIMLGMSLVSEFHDMESGKHIERIRSYTRIIANKLLSLDGNLISRQYAAHTVLYAPLHDIGKIGIPDAILKTTGVLTPEEFEIMKLHTLDGAKLLQKAEYFFMNKNVGNDFEIAAEIAESHHERYDGSGYPRGLTGDEIPLSARIVALADVYDALRTAKPYRRSYTHEEAVHIIINGDKKTSPRHFDPRILEIFNISHLEFDKVYNESVM
jgi:putative two-component system response regulator